MQDNYHTILEKFSTGDDNKSEEYVYELLDQGESVIPELVKLLGSKDSDIRWWITRTLAEFQNPPIDKIIKMLDDDSKEVRQCAALALCHHPSNNAKEALLSLMNDEDQVTSNLAATALIAIGKDIIPDLISLINLLEGTNRIECFRAIAKIGDSRATSVLMEGLNDESIKINFWCEEGLSNIGIDMLYFKPV